MKRLVATFTLPFVLAAPMAFSATDTSDACGKKYQDVSDAWTDAKTNFSKKQDVTVSTDEGEVDVTAEDAKPTENWFGKPPDAETIEGYLAAAREAKEAGDEAACIAQLKNVEDAMAQDTEASVQD